MMPSTNRPDNKTRHMTYRRFRERFGFIYGLRVPGGGCANLSRLASCEKTCQEFSLNVLTLWVHRMRPIQYL